MKTRRDKGFLLLEVLVATTLLAVGVTATLHAIFNSLQASREAQMYTQALFLGQEVMSQVESEVSFNDDYEVPKGWVDFDEAANFQWRANIDDVDDFWTRRIVVTIKWAPNEADLFNDDKTSFYRLVTEVPRPRYPEDYRR